MQVVQGARLGSPHYCLAIYGPGLCAAEGCAKANDTWSERMNPASLPGVYLDFYRYWHIGVPLEPVVIYCRSLVAVPLLASLGPGQQLLCRLSGADQRDGLPWRWP